MSRDTEGLRILARRNVLTDDDWFDLLETRRALIGPHLRGMTLSTLGELKIVRDYFSRRKLEDGGLTLERTFGSQEYRVASEFKAVEGSFPLDTRGIFPNDLIFDHGHFKWDSIHAIEGERATGERLRFWGLARNNAWIKIETTSRFFVQPRWPNVGDMRLETTAEVVKLVVSESTPREICEFCEVTPRWLLQELFRAVVAWRDHRRSLLGYAENLMGVINQENALLDIIAPETK